MKPGNALHRRDVPAAAPRSRSASPIERIAGDHGIGPDPRAPISTSPCSRPRYLVGSVGDAVGIFNYTVLGGGRIAPEPSWVRAHIGTRSGADPRLGHAATTQIFPQLEAALREIVERGLADEIHPGEYAGCYYPRFIAGTTKLSNHSFGLALDLNVPGNQRGTVGEMDRRSSSIFESWGFTWGGHWRYTDPMHFEANAIVHAG